MVPTTGSARVGPYRDGRPPWLGSVAACPGPHREGAGPPVASRRRDRRGPSARRAHRRGAARDPPRRPCSSPPRCAPRATTSSWPSASASPTGLLAGAPVADLPLLRHRLGGRHRVQRGHRSTPAAWRPCPTPRLGTTSSSCGLCGSTSHRRPGRPRSSRSRPPTPIAARRCWPRCPTRCGREQDLFDRDRRGARRGRRSTVDRRDRWSSARTSAATTRSTRSSAASCSTIASRPPASGCSSAAGRRSRSCRRRGPRASARSWRSAPRPRWRSTPPRRPGSRSPASSAATRSTSTLTRAGGRLRSRSTVDRQPDVGRVPGMTHLRPELWVGSPPNGIGQQKPNHYGEMAKVAWANRTHPKYAWKVLTKGVCDGCALGVAGLHDWTIDGVHLCTTRLRLLEVNTADAVRPVAARPTSRPLRRLARHGAARARPARPPDAPPPGRAGLPPDHLGRGARRARRRASRAAGPERIGALPHQPRHHQRDVLRGRQGGPGHGHRQRRLGGPGLPRARRRSG